MMHTRMLNKAIIEKQFGKQGEVLWQIAWIIMIKFGAHLKILLSSHEYVW